MHERVRGWDQGVNYIRLPFLSSTPAVGTGTMGSLLQTGKSINILGV